MITVTHPEHLRARAGDRSAPEPFAFYVHVDKQTSVNTPVLDFRDANTRIVEESREMLWIDRREAILLKLTMRSDRYPERKVAVLRIRASNDQFTRLALDEDWKTHCLITVCDGCRFGGNDGRCENDISGNRRTNLLHLRPDWLVTDHLQYGHLGPWLVPREGQFIEPRNTARFDLRFRHVARLTTPQRPMLFDDNRDRHVHLFDVMPTKYRPSERPPASDRG